MIVVLDSALSSVFGTTDSLVASVSTVQFLMCCAASIVLGAAVACIYMFRHKYSKNFVVTLALLPLIVQMVITLVNGNLGAGIAVMGVFNLVRFRSIPGSAKDIGSVFLAMAIGLATGMGFIALAVLFTVGGTPSVYAGDEQAFTGVKEDRAGGDDAVRPPFPDGPDDLAPFEPVAFAEALVG